MVLGVIGSGMISGIYLKNLTEKFAGIRVKSVASAHLERAEKKAAEYGLVATDVDSMLADPEIEMVVILTPVETHEMLVRKALEAGKHVYAEKTLTTDTASSRALYDLAKAKGLGLGCAPDTFLGASLQTARKAIDDGLIGDVTGFRVTATRDNTFFLSNFPFLRNKGAGIAFDYGVYYMTALVSVLGPVKSLSSFVRAPYPTFICHRPGTEEDGKAMANPNESEVTAILEMQSGVTGTYLLDADTICRDIEDLVIFGTKGMLTLGNPNFFGGEVRFTPNDWATSETPYIPVTLPMTNHLTENSRGIGPAELAYAVKHGAVSRVDASLACHVLEVLEACIQGSAGYQVKSECTRPEPFSEEQVLETETAV
ncbi:MAG: Gfo/Idh/MocA family oxidoreductase [Clostridia bacterium]|nr:Gfo/Idh/MocA family oxidoreductase [Clostridia bacterium]